MPPSSGRPSPQRVQELMRDEKLDEKAALKQAAKEFGLSKSEAYRELQRSKHSARQSLPTVPSESATHVARHSADFLLWVRC